MAPTDVLDLPFFELCNQAPTATSALSGLTTAEDGSDRFIYYLTTSTLLRYDTVADTWQQLAAPVTTPVTALSMRFTRRRGHHGRVISASSTSVVVPGLRGGALDGATIRIESGTGAGQERVLTYSTETVHDAGVITGTSTSSLADSTKKWRVNQWAGYAVGITFGTDVTNYRQVLYNDATTLYVADGNLLPHHPWGNQAYTAAAPYAVPVTTAGSQAHYVIVSATYTVPTWDVTPDRTSYFTTLTGGIYVVSSLAAAPFFSLQYYDVVADMWMAKTVPQSLVGAALGTDFSLERTGKIGSALVTVVGTVSGGSRTLTDSGLSLVPDRYANHRIVITGGTGIGQSRRIVAHTATVFTVQKPWGTNPDATSTYEVWPDYTRLYLTGGAAAAMYAYCTDDDYWMQGHAFDDGVTANITATMSGWVPVGVTSGTRLAAGVTGVNATPTAAGSGYVVGDVLTCSVGGTGAQVLVTGVTPTGGVTSIALVHSGTATGFTTGTGKAITGGTGTSCTIEITSVGVTSLVTTASAHWFQTGDSVTFAGCSESAWNAAHTIIGVPSTTTFCVATTATGAMSATASQGTTTIVDPSKNWTPGEHVGRLVHLCVAGNQPTSQIRWITANTDKTLTVATITAGVNGTSKYVIYDAKVFGVDDQRKETGRGNSGWATGGSTTTLVDSTKNWVPNQWAGYLFRIEAGTGYGSGRIAVTSNTETTLTFATQTFTPDATTKYEVADSWGLASAGSTTSITEASSKNWGVNQWAGKRVRVTAGTNLGQEASITSNTATALTTGTITAPDATSAYAILGIPARGAGTQLVWAWGATGDRVARYMYSPRGGGSNTMDVFDLSTGKWTFGIHFHPQNEGFAAGSSYAYAGGDDILMSRSGTGAVIRILRFDTKRHHMRGFATTTFLQGTAHIGNLMEVVTSGGNEFVYVLQNTGNLLARALMW